MKPKALITTHLASALLATAASIYAQDFGTVFDSTWFGLIGPCGDIGADAFGNVYAVGRTDAADGSSVAIVIGSEDGGASWAGPLDQFHQPNLNYSYYRSFGADPTTAGHVFAGGNLNNVIGTDSNGNPIYEYDAWWIIREQDPVTGEWHTAEDYWNLVNEFGQATVTDLKVAQDGTAFAVGGGVYSGWIVRRRSAVAPLFSPFSTVDKVPASAAALGMTVDPVQGAIVVGQVGGLWTVRRSQSGDTNSWNTLEQVVPVRRGEWGGGAANAAAVSSSGTIFVAGKLFNNSTLKSHWIVRSSSDGGATWTVSDNVIPAGGDAEPFGMAAGGDNQVYVCGRVQQSDGYHWVIRQGTQTITWVKQKKTLVPVTTMEWATIDDFQLFTGKNSRANAITVDTHGNVLAGGSGLDTVGVQRFVVRKRAAGQ